MHMQSECGEVVLLDVGFELEPTIVVRQVVGKRIYSKTRYLVLRRGAGHMLVEIETAPPALVNGKKILITRITEASVLANARETVFCINKGIDVQNATQMARHAKLMGARCLVIQGKGMHIGFVLDPSLMYIDIHDVIPPLEPRLFTLFAEAIPLIRHAVVGRPMLTFLDKLGASSNYESIMYPCETDAIEIRDKTVHYLNRAPPSMPPDIELIGCDVSLRTFMALYGVKPAFTNICPRLLDTRNGYHLARCCEIKRGWCVDERLALVPNYPHIDEIAGAVNELLG